MDTKWNCYHFWLLSDFRGGRQSFRQSFRQSLRRLPGLLQRWSEQSAQRRRLAQLDDRMMKDVGLSRADAYRESSKWFWQD